MASGERKEQFAARSLNQARAAAEAGNLPLASSELQRLITTYKGTDAAHEAVITLNQIRMVNGQSELAAVGLREYLATKPPEKYLSPANGLLGASLENSKRWAEAANAYTQASNAAEVPYLKATYLVDAGRAYREAGQDRGRRQGLSHHSREVFRFAELYRSPSAAGRADGRQDVESARGPRGPPGPVSGRHWAPLFCMTRGTTYKICYVK